jgi:hypothetical protein
LVESLAVTASETEGGRTWDENKIKTITGGDEASARFMRGDFFEKLVPSWHKFFCEASVLDKQEPKPISPTLPECQAEVGRQR